MSIPALQPESKRALSSSFPLDHSDTGHRKADATILCAVLVLGSMFFSSTASAGTRYGCWDREFEDLHSCLQYDAEVKASPPGDAVTYIFRSWLDSGWLPRDNHLDFRQVKTTIVRPGDGSFVSFGKATLYRCTFNPGVTPNGSDPAFSTNCPAEPPPADPPKMAGGVNPDLCCGNPVNVGTGNKYQRERDYVGSGPFPLMF